MIPIAEIYYAKRFRKDLGDLRSLVSSIAEVGLMHPIVVRNGEAHKYQLIAGQRRLEACKLLGWKKVPVTILDIKEIAGELHENVVRKDFVMSERVAILEEIQKLRIGHRPRKDSNLESYSKFQKENKDMRSVDIVSKLTGISQGELAKKKLIVEAAEVNPSKFGILIPKIPNSLAISKPFIPLVRSIKTSSLLSFICILLCGIGLSIDIAVILYTYIRTDKYIANN